MFAGFVCKKLKEKSMDWLILLGIFGGWLALQLWILPKFGVST